MLAPGSTLPSPSGLQPLPKSARCLRSTHVSPRVPTAEPSPERVALAGGSAGGGGGGSPPGAPRQPRPPSRATGGGCRLVPPVRWAAATPATPLGWPDEHDQGFNTFRDKLQRLLECVGEHVPLEKKWAVAGDHIDAFASEKRAGETVEKVLRVLRKDADGSLACSDTTKTVGLAILLFSIVAEQNGRLAEAVDVVQQRLLSLIYVVAPPVAEVKADVLQVGDGSAAVRTEAVSSKTNSQALRQLWTLQTAKPIEELEGRVSAKHAHVAGIQRALKRWQDTMLKEVFRQWRNTAAEQAQQKCAKDLLAEAGAKTQRLQVKLNNSELARMRLEDEIRAVRAFEAANPVHQRLKEAEESNAELREAALQRDGDMNLACVVVARACTLNISAHEWRLRAGFLEAESTMSFMDWCFQQSPFAATWKQIPSELTLTDTHILKYFVVMCRVMAPNVLGEACADGCEHKTTLETANRICDILDLLHIRLPISPKRLSLDTSIGAACRAMVLNSLSLRVLQGPSAGQPEFETDEEGVEYIDKDEWSSSITACFSKQQQCMTHASAIMHSMALAVCCVALSLFITHAPPPPPPQITQAQDS